MCVAIAKPVGAKLPSDEALDNCHFTNRDGCGVAWASGGVVHIKKDFEDHAAMKEWLRANITEEMGCLIHYRFATSGGVKIGLRHPFPITMDHEKLLAPEVDTDMAVIHNGVLWTMPKAETLSDTARLVRDVLADPAIKASIRTNEAIQKLIGGLLGASNKIALLWPDGHIIYFGEFEKDHGVLYSNGQYKTYVHGYQAQELDYMDGLGQSYGCGANAMIPNRYKDFNKNRRRMEVRNQAAKDNTEYCCKCYVLYPKKKMYLFNDERLEYICRECKKKGAFSTLERCEICQEEVTADELINVYSDHSPDDGPDLRMCITCDATFKGPQA